MVEIIQEENPIVEKLKICTVVAVFAPLGKTLLQFGLNSRVTHFFCLIDATGLCFFSNSKTKSVQKHLFSIIFRDFWKAKRCLFVLALI